MEYRRLGRSGLQVSAVSFGSWLTFGLQISDDLAEDLMILAYDNGVNFFDNAEVYAAGKSEIVMGNILKKTGWNRDTFVVSSKVFWGGSLPNQKGLSRKHVYEACHAALKRLQVDYLDLYYCHRPDYYTPVEETVRAMTELVQQGKVLYWGTSEWNAEQIMEAYSVARQYNLIPPNMEQPQYNMFHREKVEVEFHRLYREIGLGTTIWSPLASGLLTGKYNEDIPEGTRISLPKMEWLKEQFQGEEFEIKRNKVKQLQKIADELGINMPNLAIAWCLKNENVSTVITGASKISHLKDNIKAVDAIPLLSTDVMERIENVLQNKKEFKIF
jgi:voltage-dependent potassium channel beta subunit